MFINRTINGKHVWNGKCIVFDPDSSPEVWQHYKQFYFQNGYLKKHYDFEKLSFYNYYKNVGFKSGYFDGVNWLNYVNIPIKNNPNHNRLFILQKGTKTEYIDDIEFIIATKRLGGDCDFNFNKKKYNLFLEIIKSDMTALKNEKDYAVQQLKRCRDMHHKLLNFSLMQAVGNMQSFKGGNRFDRLDTFVLELDKYYRGISNAILGFASPNNTSELISFLNDFKDVYEYCAVFYFIDDKSFVDEIIGQGELPITNVSELVRYMTLAEKYWSKKEFEFLKNEFLKIGDYFQSGGEVYSRNELTAKIENDFGYSKEDIDTLIDICVERGFIIQSSNNTYTR